MSLSIIAMMLSRFELWCLFLSCDSNSADNNHLRQEYRFGTMKYPHGFCPTCGTSVYARAEGGEYDGIVAVNVSCKGLHQMSVRIWLADGRVGTNPEECWYQQMEDWATQWEKHQCHLEIQIAKIDVIVQGTDIWTKLLSRMRCFIANTYGKMSRIYISKCEIGKARIYSIPENKQIDIVKLQKSNYGGMYAKLCKMI